MVVSTHFRSFLCGTVLRISARIPIVNRPDGKVAGGRLFLFVFLLSGCAHLVNISYPPEAVVHPAFNQRFTSWEGEHVEVALTPPLRGDAFPYLANCKQILVADLIRQRGLRHEYNVPGKAHRSSCSARTPSARPKKNIIRQPVLSWV